MNVAHLSRRHFISSLGASLVSLGTLTSTAPPAVAAEKHSSLLSSITVGSLDAPPRNNVLYLAPLNNNQRLREVQLLEGTAVRRGRPATLDDFQPGDQLVAYGQWGDEPFYASKIDVLYRIVRGTVLEKNETSDSLKLSDGSTITLADTTAYHHREGGDTAHDHPSLGDSIVVRGWYAAGAGPMIAAMIAFRS